MHVSSVDCCVRADLGLLISGGGISQGESKEQALENIREAIDLYVESLREDGLAVPEDRFQAEVVNV
jgi:predicted RNase H-like HicB family nuclease